MKPRLASPAWMAGALVAIVAPATSRAQDLGALTEQVRQVEGRADQLGSLLNEQENPQREIPPYTERFAEAELLFRLRDYARASVLFTDIVENYAGSPAYSNSLYLLGEALYQAGDRLGARARFTEVIQHANDPVFRPFVQRSLGRLIEIALRTGDTSNIEELFALLGQMPSAEIEAQTTYVRGKYYFLRAQPDYELARQSFDAVPTRAPVYPQARYFLGAILTAQGRYPEAIEAFQRVLRIQPEGPEQQEVLDLASLAVGRLEIERNNYEAAIEAYQQVGRSSPHFDRALFEQAWAFIRLGDTIRAEHALEILSISNPDSPLIAEGKLLWGNLLLRTGRFDLAQQVFQQVRTQFGPVSEQLNELVARNQDPAQYFRELLLSNIQAFDASSFFPAAALPYVRSEGILEDSLVVINDLNTCRQYIRESEELIARLNAALSSPSRAHVFRDLRTARENVFETLNRITQLRAQLGLALDAAGSGVADVNLQGLSGQRRGLDASVDRLPVTDAQIRRRDRAAENEFSNLAQEVQRNEQRVATLEAMVVAIQRYLDNPGQNTGNLNLDTVRAELAQHREAINNYRERIAELRRLLIAGRSQIGVGDPRYQRDLEILREYRDLVDRQAQILRQAGRMPADLEALLRRLDAAQQRVEQFDARVGTVVDRRIGVLRTQVQEEETRVVGYRQRLGQLEGEASDVVGNLVMESLRNVRLHFYQIVMRADLGLVDVAWEEREEHHTRERVLAEEENREMAALNDEFREVTEGVENAPPPANTPPTPAPQTPTPPTPPPPTTPAGDGGATSPNGQRNNTP